MALIFVFALSFLSFIFFRVASESLLLLSLLPTQPIMENLSVKYCRGEGGLKKGVRGEKRRNEQTFALCFDIENLFRVHNVKLD